MRLASEGDIVLIYNERDGKYFVRRLTSGGRLQTHTGEIFHDDLIGTPIGSRVLTHLGSPYLLFLPTTDELVRNLKRRSQIIFPKDAGYLVMKLGIVPGSRVLEAGTGSGGLCVILASIVGSDGQVYSYDVREDMSRLAAENLAFLGLDDRVTFTVREAADGFDEADLDAVILDMLEPWRVLEAAHAALRGGGMLGCLVPTVNQLTRLIANLKVHPGFGFIEAEELLLRPFKTLPERIRPEDRIVGHTGYLVFARALVRSDR
nr:tRNA (adenine-N1)-methyltransferase [Anaerolineae bacterium]